MKRTRADELKSMLRLDRETYRAMRPPKHAREVKNPAVWIHVKDWRYEWVQCTAAMQGIELQGRMERQSTPFWVNEDLLVGCFIRKTTRKFVSYRSELWPLLIPDTAKRAAFLRGDKNEFFK